MDGPDGWPTPDWRGMGNKSRHKRRGARIVWPRSPDVLDVRGAAGLLSVSADTVYALFVKGDLPGRKVGRKWLTTKEAVLRWIEGSDSFQPRD
jgi:excisionase family DNA binding protein